MPFLPANGAPVLLTHLRKELVKKGKMSPVTLTRTLKELVKMGILESGINTSGRRQLTYYKLANVIDPSRKLAFTDWFNAHMRVVEGGLLMALRDVVRDVKTPQSELPMFTDGIGSGDGVDATMFQALVTHRAWSIAAELQGTVQSYSDQERAEVMRQIEKRLAPLIRAESSLRYAETMLERFASRPKARYAGSKPQ